MEAIAIAKPFAGIGRHLSHSQVSLFDRCQVSWYLKYVKGIEKPPTLPMLAGSCYHRALALNLRQKCLTGVDVPVEQVTRCYIDEFDAAVASGGVDIAYGQDTSPFREPVVRVLEHYYYEHVVGNMEPLLAEHQFVSPVPGTDRLFAGIIDVQLTDGTIIDFKLTGRKKPDAEMAGSDQASAYALLCGWNGSFEFHVGLRANRKPAVQVVSTQRTAEDVDGYVRHLQEVVRQMADLEQGRAEPTLCTGFCSERTCQYWQECQDWRYGAL